MNLAHISRVTGSLAILGSAACTQTPIDTPSIETEFLHVGFTEAEAACTIGVMRTVLTDDEINDAALVLKNNDVLFRQTLRQKRKYKLAKEMQDIALVAHKIEAFRDGTIHSFNDLTEDQLKVVSDIPQERKLAMASYTATLVKECGDKFSGNEIK